MKPMSNQKRGPREMPTDDRAERDRVEEALDEALAGTFPASDPVSITPDPAPPSEESAAPAGRRQRPGCGSRYGSKGGPMKAMKVVAVPIGFAFPISASSFALPIGTPRGGMLGGC